MNPLQTFFYSLRRSLFDIKYYKDVAEASFGFSFKYLWFMMLILVLIKGTFAGAAYIRNRPHIAPGVTRIMEYAKDMYPEELELNISKGQLTTNVTEPYIFDAVPGSARRGEDPHMLIIDTQGSIENYPYYNTYVLATRNAVVYPSKSNNNEIQQTSVFYFRDLKQDFTFNRSVYDGFINRIRPYAANVTPIVDSIVVSALIMFTLFGSLFMTFFVMAGLAVLTFFTWLVSLIFRKQYGYGSLFKMGMHAVTWPIIISELVRYFNPSFPNLYSLIFFVEMIVILFALKPVAKPAPTKLIARKKTKSKK